MDDARGYMATCPGERYAISPAVCKSRRERNYPRCRGCVFNPARGPGQAETEEGGVTAAVARSIFKAYDIRGTYPAEIDVAIARRIGQAVAVFLKAHTLVVGHDVRVSSPELSEALIDGILSVGTNVADVGMCSTPFHYFAVGTLECDGGIQVTASHNPPQYNGFKVSGRGVVPVGSDSGLNAVRSMVESDEAPPPAKKRGRCIPMDLKERYFKHVLKHARPGRALKVAVDASNGASGPYILPIFRELPHKSLPLYLEPDGRFLHHDPNPMLNENILDLADRVHDTAADVGVALDGDGDRVVFLSQEGKRIPNDIITALVAREVLDREPGAAIVYDLRSSWVVREEIEKAGGRPIEERVGHAFIKKTMRDHDAAFGGELSGHFYFRDNFFADSGLIAMLKVLNVLSQADRPMSELVEPLMRYHGTGEVNFRVADQGAKLIQLERQFSDGEISHLDGITVRYPDWWFNVRPSNTEPFLRLTMEARTVEVLASAKGRVFDVLGKPVS